MPTRLENRLLPSPRLKPGASRGLPGDFGEFLLPDGAQPECEVTFASEWDRMCVPFEKIGLRVIGFSPAFFLCDARSNASPFEMPMYAADRISTALNTTAASGTQDELVQLVKRLARQLRASTPDSDLPTIAMDYLQRTGLTRAPSRGDYPLPGQRDPTRWHTG